MYFLLLYLLLPSKQTSTQRSTLPNSLGICCLLASAIFLQLKTRTSDLSNQLFFPLLSLFHCIKAFHWKIQVRYRPEPLSSQCRKFDNKYPVGNHYTSWGDLFDSKIGGTESDFENRGLDNLSSYELKICTESLRTFKVFDVKTHSSFSFWEGKPHVALHPSSSCRAGSLFKADSCSGANNSCSNNAHLILGDICLLI